MRAHLSAQEARAVLGSGKRATGRCVELPPEQLPLGFCELGYRPAVDLGIALDAEQDVIPRVGLPEDTDLWADWPARLPPVKHLRQLEQALDALIHTGGEPGGCSPARLGPPRTIGGDWAAALRRRLLLVLQLRRRVAASASAGSGGAGGGGSQVDESAVDTASLAHVGDDHVVLAQGRRV